MDLRAVLRDVAGGHRLTKAEAVRLMKAQGRDVLRIAAAADELRELKVGNTVTYVRNQNLHVTNICKNLCGFCGFGRGKGDKGAYCMYRPITSAADDTVRPALMPHQVNTQSPEFYCDVSVLRLSVYSPTPTC